MGWGEPMLGVALNLTMSMEIRHYPIPAFSISVNFRTRLSTAGGVADSGGRGARKPSLVLSSNLAGSNQQNSDPDLAAAGARRGVF